MRYKSVREPTYHKTSVEFIKPLDCSVTEAVAQVFLYEVGVVQDIICYQGLLTRPSRTEDICCVIKELQAGNYQLLLESYQLYNKYLVGNMLLFHRGMSFGVNEGWMCHQITPVLHDEAPEPKQVTLSSVF